MKTNIFKKKTGQFSVPEAYAGTTGLKCSTFTHNTRRLATLHITQIL